MSKLLQMSDECWSRRESCHHSISFSSCWYCSTLSLSQIPQHRWALHN